MTWAKLDDKLHSRADTLAAGNEAMGVWVRCESYCADHETDGHLPRAVVELISGGKKSMHRLGGLLVKAGLWSETPGGYLSVGFLDRNPSKADADAKRAAETARKKAQRDRRPGIGPTDVPHGVPPGQDAESHPLSHPCPAPPVPDPYPFQAGLRVAYFGVFALFLRRGIGSGDFFIWLGREQKRPARFVRSFVRSFVT